MLLGERGGKSDKKAVNAFAVWEGRGLKCLCIISYPHENKFDTMKLKSINNIQNDDQEGL